MIIVSAQAFPPSLGGIQNLMQGLASHAAGHGHEVLVLADGGREARGFDRDVRAPYRIKRYSGPRPLRRFAKARRIGGLQTSGRLKAVFADSWKSLEALPAGRLRLPVVAYVHGNEINGSTAKHLRIRRALSRADHLICVSADTEARCRDLCPEGVPLTILNPPVHDLDEPDAHDIAYAQGLWQGDGPRFVSMSRLIAWKGIDQAIRAVARYGSGRLVVAGDGDDRARLEAIAREEGVADRVTFAGEVNGGRKTALLRGADLFLQPGRQIGIDREGFGISYTEAALAGLPSVSGNKGGAPEAVRHDETGLVVDGESCDEVLAAIRTIVEDPATHARMAEAGRRLGRSRVWNNQIRRILHCADL